MQEILQSVAGCPSVFFCCPFFFIISYIQLLVKAAKTYNPCLFSPFLWFILTDYLLNYAKLSRPAKTYMPVFYPFVTVCFMEIRESGSSFIFSRCCVHPSIAFILSPKAGDMPSSNSEHSKSAVLSFLCLESVGNQNCAADMCRRYHDFIAYFFF